LRSAEGRRARGAFEVVIVTMVVAAELYWLGLIAYALRSMIR
jgi:hypothetical protein